MQDKGGGSLFYHRQDSQARNLIALDISYLLDALGLSELLDLLALRDPLGGGEAPPLPLYLLDLIDLGSNFKFQLCPDPPET